MMQEKVKHISPKFCPQHSKTVHSQATINKEIDHTHIDVKPPTSTMDSR
jgi:hypothetical protein